MGLVMSGISVIGRLGCDKTAVWCGNISRGIQRLSARAASENRRGHFVSSINGNG
jgi:hypothetical protein